MTGREEKLRSGKFPVDAALVRRLVAQQFPQWSDLDIRAVAVDGWDNWTFHLGDEMKVRLPSAPGYAGQATKEAFWLPRLAPHLPFEVPDPIAIGDPSDDFPWSWSIYNWIEGNIITRDIDRVRLAQDVAKFLNALQTIDTAGGPPPGDHNFLRGSHPTKAYGKDARIYVDQLAGVIDQRAAHAVLDAAEQSTPQRSMWVHGDIAVGNFLTRNGHLSAVIDFGGLTVGDPSCDLVLAWVFLDGASRQTFRSLVAVDDETWARGRAWALWKAALLAVSGGQAIHRAEHSPLAVITAVISDFEETSPE